MARQGWVPASDDEPIDEPGTAGRLARLAELASLATRAAVRSWAAATGTNATSASADDRVIDPASDPASVPVTDHATDPATDPVGSAATTGQLADLASAAALGAALSASRVQPATEPADAHAVVPLSWRSGWTAFLLSAVARAALILIACLLVTSVAFTPLGWHPTVVMSNSMAPRLTTGDVVVSRPVSTDKLRVGQIVLVSDPDHAGRLRLHRLAVIRPDGMLILRGDANRADDSTPVAPRAVHGVASLRVPYIGTAMWLLRTRNYHDLAILAAVLAVLLAAACLHNGCYDDEDDKDDGDSDAPDSDGDRRHGRRRRLRQDDHETPSAAGEATRTRSTRVAVRRVGAVSVLTAIVISAGITAAGPARAATRFSRTSSTPASSWVALPSYARPTGP